MAVEAMGGHRALHLLSLKLSGRAKRSEDDPVSFDPAFRSLLERELDVLLAEVAA